MLFPEALKGQVHWEFEFDVGWARGLNIDYSAQAQKGTAWGGP